MTLLEHQQQNLLLHFSRNGSYRPGGDELLVLTRGDGVHVWDDSGNRYFDGLSSLFCAQLGYGHSAEMAAVAAAQITELPFSTTWGAAHPRALELAARVAALAPPGMDHVFFTSGGSESVEAAWKLVRQFHLANGEPQRVKAIARDRAYHGVTLGALSFTGVPGVKEPFGRPAIDVRHVSNTNAFRRSSSGDHASELLAEIEAVILAEDPATVAMLIAEPVQNAGGCLQPPTGYWDGLRALCDRHGILLVADEVITGFGRLGEWFGVTRFGAVPDLITVAKGLTSAYAPMGAVVVSSRVAAAFYGEKAMLQHGITFGGHPLSAALALASIDIFERDGVLANVVDLQGYLGSALAGLLRYPLVADVRGSGFFWALEFVPDGGVGRFSAAERESLLRGFLPGALRRAGLIARGDDRGDTVLLVAPPLVCTSSDLDELVSRVTDVVEACSTHMNIPLS